MKPSKFQFINPYLMEVNYKINADFNADEIKLICFIKLIKEKLNEGLKRNKNGKEFK